MNINKQSLQAFRLAHAEAVKSLEKQFGVKIELGNISYDDDGFGTKTTVTNVGNLEEDEDPREVIYMKHCKKHGLSQADYGKVLTDKRTKLKIVGIKVSARTYVVELLNLRTNKIVVGRADYVLKLLKSI